MARLRYNALKTGAAGSGVPLALGASLTSSATSVTFNAALTYNNGTAVPTITSPDYIPLEILDSSGNMTEIVYLTAYTSGGTSGTIVRGKEGTTGVAHSSGDKIVHGATVTDVLGDPTPTSPTASSDEFDGTGSLSWANGPTAPTSFDINSTRPSHAVIRANGIGNTFSSKIQAVPGSTPFTIKAKLSGTTARLASNTVGICLTPASPTTASPLLFVGVQMTATTETYFRALYTDHNASSATLATARQITTGSGNTLKGQMPLYLRFDVASATSVAVAVSWDGWNWIYTDTALNPGFTPGMMGLTLTEFGTADVTAHFDFFRVT